MLCTILLVHALLASRNKTEKVYRNCKFQDSSPRRHKSTSIFLKRIIAKKNRSRKFFIFMKTFRTFYSFLWKYKGYFILSQITSLSAIVLYSLMPFIYRYLVDNFYTLTAKSFIAVVVLYGVSKIGSIIIGNISWFLSEKVINPASVDTKVSIFSHLQKLDFAFHTGKRSGALISKIKRGSSALENIDSAVNRELTDDLFQLVIVAVVFSMVNLKITYIFLSFIAIIISSSIFLIKKNIKARVEHNKEEDNISHIIADNLINYETVKYFANEKREILGLVEAFKKWTQVTWKLVWTFLQINVSVRLLSSVGTIVILAILGGDVINKKITVGDFVLVMTFTMQIFPSIEKIVFRLRGIMRNYADLKDYFDILDYPLVVKDLEKPNAFHCNKGEVVFENVSFSYPDGQGVIKNVSQTMPAGMSSALVGRSGSGKTTMTKLLMRLYDPAEGRILVDGTDISRIKKEDLRRVIGIVPQEPILFNSTIGYNIGYPLDNATKEDIEEAAKLANLHNFIISLEKGYDTVVGERGVKLSGGQKQRLAIARVFLLNPKIIIFDEATSHLDSESERMIQESLERLSKGKTLIIIAHRLSTIMRADKIIVLDQGKVTEEGLHSELIGKTRGIYKKLWELQTDHEIE